MSRSKKSPQKKLALAAGGALLLWAAFLRSATKGKVIVGPVTVTNLPPVKFDKQTDAEVQRLSLALIRVRQVLGWDPNTMVSLQPSPSDQKFVEDTIALNQKLSNQTAGVVPWPTNEMKWLALAKTLPGSQLQAVNRQFYSLLGIDSSGENEPTVALTPATEAAARNLIAKWRPYSQDATDTLFALLDQARELGGDA